jgi:hypothetical protein
LDNDYEDVATGNLFCSLAERFKLYVGPDARYSSAPGDNLGPAPHRVKLDSGPGSVKIAAEWNSGAGCDPAITVQVSDPQQRWGFEMTAHGRI